MWTDPLTSPCYSWMMLLLTFKVCCCNLSHGLCVHHFIGECPWYCKKCRKNIEIKKNISLIKSLTNAVAGLCYTICQKCHACNDRKGESDSFFHLFWQFFISRVVAYLITVLLSHDCLTQTPFSPPLLWLNTQYLCSSVSDLHSPTFMSQSGELQVLYGVRAVGTSASRAAVCCRLSGEFNGFRYCSLVWDAGL